MAVEKPKLSTATVPKRSRLEMNVRLLLNKCEFIAKQEPVDGNWRLKKYVESLNEMISELKTGPDKPSKDVLATYTKRASFLKGLIQTASLHSPIEKLEAVQQLSHGAATMCVDAAAQEIHQKTVVKYGDELRSELFGIDDTDEALRKRNIIKAPNFTSNSSSQEDIDSLLKYHQNMQEKVAENMVMLTKSLKEQSQIASTIIRGDTEALKKSSDLTDRNLMSLNKESSRLQEHSKSAWKCWLWLMLAVVMAIFINMVLFMKVMKKRKYEE
ncbi:vesicle transport protein USE1 [Plodia interpunctella]|uniref:vesicle transport protein USE1 n=1 Tax=Plodia interpunctella TaxID=58824 RepID=UPI002368CB89|nr:vesicle transport protein USE1 [Plodia interpunctella]XP_053615126.1 vesicle transport protein USE1 [Plodia interpunctella]